MKGLASQCFFANGKKIVLAEKLAIFCLFSKNLGPQAKKLAKQSENFLAKKQCLAFKKV